MPCFHPIPAWRSPLGALSLREPREPTPGTEYLRLPCGGCIGCRTARAREWAFRCSLEAKEHDHSAFVTLTYRPDDVPPTLQKQHVSSWLKRLRERVRPRSLRFFACGEYGERNHRPHYHALVFGLPPTTAYGEEVEKAWGKGFTRTEAISPARIAYVAGYVAKKVGWQLEKGVRVDYETGEEYEYQPPFVIMSRRPGVGGEARKYAESWRSFAVYDGQQIPVPRFLHQAWLRNATETQIQQLKEEKLQLSLAKDTGKERLRAAEQQAIARQRLSSERRTL